VRLVLASASPRRREILTALGIDYVAVAPDAEEIREGRPEDVVLENARRKARAGLAESGVDAVVLGADTEVVMEARVLGKPSGEREARELLGALSGRTHTVLTGVVLLGPRAKGGEVADRSGVSRSEVAFRGLDSATLELYIRSGEWRGRAGAYAIQGLGSMLIKRLEGDFSNVVGLPVPLLLELAPELFGCRRAPT
jgi:nucleoside triphosphate pyrophosphatase